MQPGGCGFAKPSRVCWLGASNRSAPPTSLNAAQPSGRAHTAVALWSEPVGEACAELAGGNGDGRTHERVLDGVGGVGRCRGSGSLEAAVDEAEMSGAWGWRAL